MSMIVCSECSRYIDSDDDPDCFVLIGRREVVLCEPCREEREMEDAEHDRH